MFKHNVKEKQLNVFPSSTLDRAKMSVCDCVRLIPEKMAKEFSFDSMFIIIQFNNYVIYTES